MAATDVGSALRDLFAELADGVAGRGGFVLNGGDPGLLGSLDRLSAEEASQSSVTGSSIAAHTDHVRYGLSLFNRWSPGTNPFAGADWTESWRRTRVTEEEWDGLRQALADEAHRWMATLGEQRELSEVELKGVIGSVAHLAYHLGAIRQIVAATRGPTAEEG